ncbi:MAG: DUF2802 domain-containing protein [Aeromonadaceae bacterium]|nr:DUF2802 domain-containing protein [Aeromonadaceae bacterium]
MDTLLILFLLVTLALAIASAGVLFLWRQIAHLQRKLSAMELLIKELTRVKESTRKQLTELHANALGVGGKVTEMEKAILAVAERQQEISHQDPERKLYSRAAKMVELGAGLDEIMAECEIPKAEAELLISLRSKAAR